MSENDCKMDKYLIDLIERMSDTSDQIMEGGYDSSKTISWKALREAEKIENADFIPQLFAFIDHQKDKKKRSQAYFILGHIAKNLNDTTALNYLINRVDKETDKYVIASLLDRIASINKPAETDLQPLISATKNESWLIRHSAIQSLNNSVDTIAETALIAIIDNSDDPYNLIYAISTLNRIGTPRAIPYLEKQLKSKKTKVKNAAKFAIEAINKRYKNESTAQ